MEPCLSFITTPREFDRTSTIQLAFKRRLQYKGSYIREWVRPHAVYRAAEYLVKQPFYQEEGIGVSFDFLASHQLDNEEFVVDGNDVEAEEEKIKIWRMTTGTRQMVNKTFLTLRMSKPSQRGHSIRARRTYAEVLIG